LPGFWPWPGIGPHKKKAAPAFGKQILVLIASLVRLAVNFKIHTHAVCAWLAPVGVARNSPISRVQAASARTERLMNIKTNTHGGEEVAGTKFLTWAIITVAAGLAFATTAEFASSAAPQTQTVQAAHVHHAS
jgi:hypothetical protein